MKQPALVSMIALCALALFALALLPTASVRAAPAVASPSPRPSLTPKPAATVAAPPAGTCTDRVFDDLAHLVIFRCEDGALAFYRYDNGQGNFHSYLTFAGWAYARLGQGKLSRTDERGYKLVFAGASQAEIDANALAVRTPADKNGSWYAVDLSLGKTALVDTFLFLEY